jgi:UDP-glucose 4-epimerase
MKILVTGGAGYVGSIVVEQLLSHGHEVVVMDNLQQGHKAAVPDGAEFIYADICNTSSLQAVFRSFTIDAVMHLAAETLVEFYLTEPMRFFRGNVVGGLNLLEAMQNNRVDKLVFSSSAAVYGEPQTIPILETSETVPLNPYGESKLIFERILKWYGRVYGLKYIIFRYFNAAGASDIFGEDHHPETHLIPTILKTALNKSGGISVFGTDYPTRDGSCIRDYVHVVDIARAHVIALERLGDRNGYAYNLGNGDGYSVLEVIEMAKKVTGVDIPVRVCARRPGDPAVLVASSSLAKTELDWKPQFSDLEGIINSTWVWMKNHKNGYNE